MQNEPDYAPPSEGEKGQPKVEAMIHGVPLEGPGGVALEAEMAAAGNHGRAFTIIVRIQQEAFSGSAEPEKISF